MDLWILLAKIDVTQFQVKENARVAKQDFISRRDHISDVSELNY